MPHHLVHVPRNLSTFECHPINIQKIRKKDANKKNIQQKLPKNRQVEGYIYGNQDRFSDSKYLLS
jgi:uncharacterized protein YqfB (UPF0267 family)